MPAIFKNFIAFSTIVEVIARMCLYQRNYKYRNDRHYSYFVSDDSGTVIKELHTLTSSRDIANDIHHPLSRAFRIFNFTPEYRKPFIEVTFGYFESNEDFYI